MDSNISTIVHKIVKNGIKMYLIPYGTYVFKGISGKDYEKKEMLWFGFNYRTSRFYSPDVYVYKVIKNIYLYAMDDYTNVMTLLESTDNKEYQDLNLTIFYNFGFIGGVQSRYSEYTSDIKIAEYLCSLNYDGYATLDIETLDKKIFHSEMCLCRSSEFLDMENKKLVENIADLPSLLNEEKSTM